MKISCAAGNTQTDNGGGKYDGQAQGWRKRQKDDVVEKQPRSRQTWGHTGWCMPPSQHKHTTLSRGLLFSFLSFFFFLPSCRRWWTRPRCSPCFHPPPRLTRSLQTWQTTGSYCKAKKGRELSLSEQVFVKHSLKRSAISEDGCDWRSPFPVMLVHSVQLRLSS